MPLLPPVNLWDSAVQCLRWSYLKPQFNELWYSIGKAGIIYIYLSAALLSLPAASLGELLQFHVGLRIKKKKKIKKRRGVFD